MAQFFFREILGVVAPSLQTLFGSSEDDRVRTSHRGIFRYPWFAADGTSLVDRYVIRHLSLDWPREVCTEFGNASVCAE